MGSSVDVLIVGGGFGGLYAASYLGAADLPAREVRLTLVSDRNHFTFTPLLAEVLGGALGPEHVTMAYRVFGERRGFGFRLGRVEAVDPVEGRVRLTRGGSLPFDYAVLAPGARSTFFGDEGIRRHAVPFASVRDAVRLRHRILRLAERAEAERRPSKRRRRLTFVLAGAGPAGVEAASEIRHLLGRVLPRYYDLGGAGRVVLVEGGDRILRGWNEELAREGLAALRERGIEVWLRTRVTGADGRRVRVLRPDTDGRGTECDIEADTLVWTAGTVPSTDFARAGGLALERSGHLSVEPTLRVSGQERVYAVGDAARIENPRTGRPHPAVAPIAISSAVRAAGNIENSIAGRPPEPYAAHHAGKIVSLGNGLALVDILGFQLRGRPAWALYRATYLLKLVGLQNKLRAALTLGMNRVFERDLSVTG